MYKITFNIEAPICFIDHPIFDGLILYCHMKKKYGNVLVEYNENELCEIPIKIHEEEYPLSSIMFFDKSIEFIDTWKKRWDNQNDDLSDFKGKKRKIIINRAKFKSYQVPINLNSIKKVWFFFESDNIKEISLLLNNYLVGIGKKVSQGFGFFSSFKIEKEKELSFETNLLRPMNINLYSTQKLIKRIDKKTYYERFYAWKPVYSDPKNFTDCIYPEVI